MEPRLSLITLGVQDLPRAVAFYRDGLGLPTRYEAGAPVAFFNTGGVRLSLFPLEELVKDIGGDIHHVPRAFPGITLAHNVRTRDGVAQILAMAEAAGGTIVKPAQDVFWGGHAGYFTDPDGYYWEVAWNPHFPIEDDGSITLTA
jgi:catechol 2,3-dioxygenase-like lactoylglutathione lyase family enzyme